MIFHIIKNIEKEVNKREKNLMKTKAFKAALPYTLPICVGFLFLGMSYGFLMRSKGFSFVYPMLMSMFIFAGSMEFITAEILLSAFHPLHAFFLALMVNARHLFVRPRACFHCEVFRVPKNETLKTNKPPAMQVSQHCFSLQ